MKRVLISSLLVVLFAAAALAHDPRTVAKNFSHSLTIEGAGKLTLSYKSLHYNETNFNARKQERALVQFNRLWKAIGKLDTDFDVVIGGVSLVTNYRDEFNQQVQSGGIDGLIKTLAERNKGGAAK